MPLHTWNALAACGVRSVCSIQDWISPDLNLNREALKMFQPIQSAIDNKSFSELARELLAAYPEMCKVRSKKAGNLTLMAFETLAARLGELDAGEKLLWWSKKPELVQCLVQHIGISRDDLALDRIQEPYIFKFVDAPDLPAIDLRRQDHWSIAKPQFVPIDGQNRALNYATRSAMGYWLSENNLTPNTSKIEWLQVTDDLELELLIGRFKAIEKNNFISCRSLKEIYSDGKKLSLLLSYKPLIISLEEVTEMMDLRDLIKDRNEAPLMVVSPLSLPSDNGINSKTKNDFRRKVNCWKWVYQDDWRWRLVRWFGQRLIDPKYSTAFAEEAVVDWLIKHDANYQWFRTTRDVLSLCQLFSAHSEKKFQILKNISLGNGLLDLQYKRNESDRDLLKKLIENRWRRWHFRLEGDLPSTDWREISEGVCDYEKLRTNKLIEAGPLGCNFKYPMMVRLVLRDSLIEQIANEQILHWANACFDPERRPILDAALEASSTETLVKIAFFVKQEHNTVVAIAVAEALFMAIGTKVARSLSSRRIVEKVLPEEEMRHLVNFLFSKWDFSSELVRPWSRPLISQSDVVDWVMACWAWSLLPLNKETFSPNSWLFPGWSKELPSVLPQWLDPRSCFELDDHSDADDISGFTKNRSFIAVVEQWFSASNGLKTMKALESPSLFMKISVLRQASGNGLCKIDPRWWHGIIGTTWAEEAVLRDFVSSYPDGLRTPAMNWFQSLIAYLQSKVADNEVLSFKLRTRSYSTPSPVFEWVMKQLKADSSKTLDLLDHEAHFFLARNPQMLDTSFKLEILKIMAQRLPSSNWLEAFQAPGFLMNFGADAVFGVIPFLADKQLGSQAAQCLWNWDPDRAEDLLLHDDTLEISVKRSLIATCPPGSVAVAITALQCDEKIFDSSELRSWVQSRLPNAGIHATSLWELVVSV